jgi:pimeloyl-ACP methyl ester carboxylesterase
VLSHELIKSQNFVSRHIVLLHGIMGSRRNMKGFASQIIEAFPRVQILLVDLPYHGDSKTKGLSYDLQTCAEAVLALLDAQRFPLDMLMGHSFGGKVALACSELRRFNQIVVLDAAPGKIKSANLAVNQVIKVLRQLKPLYGSRKELVFQMLKSGLSRPIADWMTTNLEAGPEGLQWKFDLNAIEAMLRFYEETSYWKLLEENIHETRYDFIRAQGEDRFSLCDIEKFALLQKKGLIYLHLLPNAGHWVHIDNPKGLLLIFERFF